MFHIFSLVCFLIYGVKSRSGHDQITTFGQIIDLFSKTHDFVKKSLILIKNHEIINKSINVVKLANFKSKNVVLE